MSGALAAAGGQSDKPVRFAPMYVGRIFTGIWTNRSPLRDAASTRIEEKYYGPRGDAMIAGSNVEISDRLTMIRRPGNPIYDAVNSYAKINSFDEFRVSKGLSDAWGTTIESIYTMVDTASDLYALSSAFSRQSIFSKSTGSGQSFMKEVGNQLYWGDGVSNKKWNQSLFTRTSSNNSTLINTDSYSFMDTFLIDSNGNVQQLIGTKISTVSNVVVASNVLTLTVSDLGANQPAGTQFMLWGFTNAATKFLNGATITLSTAYTSGGTSLVAAFTHANVTQADTGYVQIESGSNPTTGSSVPTWNTTTPSSSNKFSGGITLDGTAIWVNRGSPTQNWGIKAPTDTLTFTESASVTGWSPATYYSPASVFQSSSGDLWQITTAGTTGAVLPTFPVGPTVAKHVNITSVTVAAGTGTFVTLAQTLAAGDLISLSNFDVVPSLNGQTLTVLAGGLSATGFTAAVTTPATQTTVVEQGVGRAITTGVTSTVTDGTAVWTAIQSAASLTWAVATHYNVGDFIVATASGTSCLFQLGPKRQPFLSQAISVQGWNSTSSGAFNQFFPAPAADFTLTPPSLNWFGPTGSNIQVANINGAGEIGSNVDTGHAENWEAAIVTKVFIPAAGSYTFTLTHDDGAFFSFDTAGGAYKSTGTFTEGTGFVGSPHTKTAKQGYGSSISLVGNNNSGASAETATWVFPAAGEYGLEIDWTNWIHAGTMDFQCNGKQLAITPDISSASQPAWPAFTTVGATFSNGAVVWPSRVQESAKQYTWNNLGPMADYAWTASTPFTLPNTTIVDTNSNIQGPIETGISNTSATGHPVWQTALNARTLDRANLIWLNEGGVPLQPGGTGKITATSTQGWLYAIALVNTLDNTVSNIGPVSAGTGPVISGQIVFAPGAGLPTDLTLIDSQADYVAIFRTTDGASTELLIPSNGNSIYTVPLVQYLNNGYIDSTPDTGLDTLVQAAASGENTPPLPGAVNLTFHLNRIWYSIGNTVFYTTGPLAPVGNGVNGTAPLNFDKMPSLVKRLVPTSIGVLVFTVSDVYIIETSGGTIYPGIPYAPGIGISSYNAIDINGPQIGFFTTDHQFLVFDPSGGLGRASIPLADRFQLQDGQAGTNWNPASVYVTHHASGTDMAWFVSDGSQGWYKLIPTPAPDGPGSSWSPFATISGGVGAIKSVETSPGTHQLLLGPTSTGSILARSLTATTDAGTTGANGTAYTAYAVFGSYVLVQPGQIAQVAFITTDSVNVGSPLVLGVIVDEALPYYTGSFEILKNWVTDPPNLPQSTSILGQRFFLSELPTEAAACRHLQVLVQWPAEAAANELQSFTIFGNILQEV